MDNLKKRLSWLLVLMLVFAMLPASALAAIPDGAPFTAITTDAGDAISVVGKGEMTINTWGTEYVGPLHHAVIPEGATYVDVTLNVPLAELMSASGVVYGYYGNAVRDNYQGYDVGEIAGGTSFELVSDSADAPVIRIPLYMSTYGGELSLVKPADYDPDESEAYYAAGPEYGDAANYAPVAFFTFEYGAAAGEEPACEHSETTVSYQKGENHQHTVIVTCNACGEQVGETVEDCIDVDPENRQCDLCKADYPCKHPAEAIELHYNQNADGSTHSITQFCQGCLTEIGDAASGNCADDDGDAFCDLCGGEFCSHSEYTTKFTYESKGDGTHDVTETRTCRVKACKKTFYTATTNEACKDEDGDGLCDGCGAEVKAEEPAVPITKLTFWVKEAKVTEVSLKAGEAVDAVAACTPKATTENVVLFSSSDSEILTVSEAEVTADEVYGHAKTTIQGVKVGEATLTAVSKTNPEVSAQLKVTVTCNHSGTETTSSSVYEPVGGGVHNTVTSVYCDCGELISKSTALNEECVDENADGVCDLCKGEVEVPAEDTPALIFDSSIHGAWGSTITFKKLYVSGVKVKSYEWNNGACIVTLSKDTPADAVMTFSVEGLSGGAPNSAAFYVNGSKTNLTAQLKNGQAIVEIRAAHKSAIGTQATAKNISFITEGAELVPVESIVITPENPRVVANGSLQLTATVYPENATVKDVKWSTSAASTNLTINETGKVMGQTMGMGGYYTVTATSVSNPEISASCKVFLDWKPEDSITISEETMTVKIGEPGKLSATVTGSNFVTNTAVTWSSSDESIATVDSGTVTGLKTGTVTITATSYYGLTASCKVTVTCGHVGMDSTTVYTQIEGTETHTVATTCVCGHVLGSTTEKCVDEDADGVCDKCDGAVSVNEEPKLEAGDVSGDTIIDANDAVLILQAAAGTELTDAQKAAADMNKDGVIDANDAVLILQAAAKN